MTSEQHIQQHIRLACSTGPVRLFRNNTGTLRELAQQRGYKRGWAERVHQARLARRQRI